jgi:regulator of sirC expression with transglutaminase-like and TPR domain
MGKRTQIRNEAIASSQSKAIKSRVILMVVTSIVACSVTALFFTSRSVSSNNSAQQNSVASPSQQLTTPQLIDSLLVQPSLADNTDIALLNLAVTPGLPPSDRGRIIRESLDTLDQWAKAIMAETYRNRHHYLNKPDEFGNEAGWKMAMMCSVLGKDFKVRYDPSLISTDRQNTSNDKFFANPNSIFLTGCLGESRIGTCASLPVLYVALGRRMGYPMHLVAAKGHLFARWDDGKGTRVNVEAANAGGYTSHPDSYYRTWPHALSHNEEERGGYLENLTAQQCLAIFLTSRTACLEAKGQRADAIASASAAFRLAPNLGGVTESLRLSVGGTPAAMHDSRAYYEELQRVNEMIQAQQMAHQRYEADLHFRATGGTIPVVPGAYQSPTPGVPQVNTFGQPAHTYEYPQQYNPYAPR